MAGSEGSGQTELLSGWSCVVHRPSEDPEPSELPSTVDMAAFSSGISVEPTQNTNNDDSCDSESDSDSDSNNSGSDVSGSCSQSDSSDSESSSTSRGSSSRSSSPEFSVVSNQANELKLKFRNKSKVMTNSAEKPTKYRGDAKFCDKNSTQNSVVKSSNLSSSSDSPCSRSSSESSSDSDGPSVSKSDNSDGKGNEKRDSINTKKPLAKVKLKPVEKKIERRTTRALTAASPKSATKPKLRPRRTRKIASLPLSRGSTGSSTDSEDGSESDRTMLAACSLQEIRQEDLAAILPDQQECDAFGGFDCRPDKSSPHTGDGSGSEMELPQQAVNALIQRTTESSSESESRLPLNPNTLFANSLLQQFVAQTQLLNAPCSAPPNNDANASISNQTIQENKVTTSEVEGTKRKRGRPKKNNAHKAQSSTKTDKSETTKSILNLEYCGNPNVSPDSGIQNCSDHVSSPEPSPNPNVKSKFSQDIELKRLPASADLKQKNNGENKNKSSAAKVKEKPKLSVTSTSFDRVLYGNTDRILYPPRRKVGRPPITRKGPGRPPKCKQTLQDISENEGTKLDKADNKLKSKKNKNTCDNFVDVKETKPKEIQKNNKIHLLHAICEKVSTRLNICKEKCEPNDKSFKSHKKSKMSKKTISTRVVLGNKNKIDHSKAKYTTLKNAKVMHSKHKDKKHKKCKFKILKPISATTHDPKLNSEIDKLIADFVKLCNISCTKSSKENVPEILKVLKKVSKKRKTSDYNERKKKKQSTNNSFNKEANSNEQRLPLKKRHYHLTNNDSGTITSQTDTESEMKPNTEQQSHVVETKLSNFNNNEITVKLPKLETIDTHIDEAIEACITKYASLTTHHQVNPSTVKPESIILKGEISNTSSSSSITTTTPKKRHRLEANANIQETIIASKVLTAEEEQIKSESSNNKTVVLDNVVSELKTKKVVPLKSQEPKKGETVAQIITRKKNRLEDLTLTLAHKVNSSYTPDATDNNQKRKKEVVKPEEIPENNQKRKKDAKTDDISKKKEETSTDNQKRKKDDEKRKKDEVVDNNSHRRRKETKIDDNKRKRHEDTTQVPQESSKNNEKEIVSSEIPIHPKKKKEENDNITKRKKEEELSENIQKRKAEESQKMPPRASVIKSPIGKKVKPVETEKLDSVTADQPTGIFMPTIDIELHIPASKIQTLHATDAKTKSTKAEEPQVFIENLNFKDSKSELNKTKILESENISKKRIRKRRAINRTGFPTVKKKKKRIFPLEPTNSFEHISQKLELTEETIVCDRVPKEGEKYISFLQRTEKLNVSNAILEKLQKSESTNCTPQAKCPSQSDEDDDEIEEDEEESMHELGVTKNGQIDSCMFGSDSGDEKRDDKSSTSDLDEISLELRLELLQSANSERSDSRWRTRLGRNLLKGEKHSKRKIRDLSPSSSSEPFTDKRSRDDMTGSGDETRRSTLRKAPRWRKKFLIAGLFSDYYKENDEAVRLKRTELATKSKIAYNPEEHPYGLLPPPYHCGRYLRCRKIPFQLPYDLWWQHTNSQLPGRDIVPSWNYRKIRTNVYNVRTTGGACEPQPCNCSPASGCGDDCINRLVLAECPATHKCQNQKIQKHEWAPGIEKFMTVDKGWGVRTKQPIKSGEFILEYVGEVVSDQEFKERMASRYAHDTHHYCLHLDGGLVIDGHRMGGDGRFVNHSCEPNCEMQKWSVNGQFRMALFALRDIRACEELTYDYNFSLFNPAEGQECKCGSTNCRGVIGGKSQRIRQVVTVSNTAIASDRVGRVGRPRKNQAKRTTSGPKELPIAPIAPPITAVPSVKPMNNTQRSYVREHHCFLLRNLNKTKHNRERSVCPVAVNRASTATPTDHNPTTFLNHLNALRQPRNMKTRRLAQAEDDPELKKVAQLAAVLKDLLNIVTTANDEKKELLCSMFMNLPSKRKVPEYYQRITDPIDIATIEQNVATGVYRTVDQFDSDMNKVFLNAVRFFGRTSEPGIAATRLKKIYVEAKQNNLKKLEEVLGEKVPVNFISSKKKGEEEDVIRCICGMYRDEGLMIQCERCLVWQHCECVRADAAAASYHCEKCVPREVNYEIALDEYTEHGHQYYMTLLRGDLQLRQGDTVYMLRDIPIPGTDRKHTYKTINEIKYTDLDIFRVERLWKDCKTGQRFAYGHHYLRPHETFHEPTRKFFANEVMRVPLYEAVPVELVISHCWVMDINTYCKGRPIEAPEEHIYICEYRVDKSARLFSKISKSKYPICTKTYAFERFDTRLKVSRTYTPHDLDPSFVKPRGRKPQENEDMRELPQLPVHVPVIRTQSEKKTRLNKILLTLLNKMPTKQALDVSYLLEGGRRRKKQLEK